LNKNISEAFGSLELKKGQSIWTRWWYRWRDTVHGYMFLSPFLLFYAIFSVCPIIAGFIISLFNWDLVGTNISFKWFDNYKSITNLDITKGHAALVLPPLSVTTVTLHLG
jgi:ABC-type sugar transport system permease subunit